VPGAGHCRIAGSSVARRFNGRCLVIRAGLRPTANASTPPAEPRVGNWPTGRRARLPPQNERVLSNPLDRAEPLYQIPDELLATLRQAGLHLGSVILRQIVWKRPLILLGRLENRDDCGKLLVGEQ